jgi:Tol biopolymer transport system component
MKVIPGQWYSHVRISPDGKRIAFEVHDGAEMAMGGRVVLLDLVRKKQVASQYFSNLAGLAWPPNNKEVWFTAASKGMARGLHAIDANGHERLVYQAPVALTLQDISANGDVLATRDMAGSKVFLQSKTDNAQDSDLSIFDWSALGDISSDGKTVALLDSGDVLRRPGIYLRNATGGPATNLGEATAPVAFSPDGKSLLALSNDSCPHAVLLSTEQRPQMLTRSNLCVSHALWSTDARHILFDASEPGHKSRCYQQTLGQNDARPFTDEGTFCALASPDGKYALIEKEDSFFKIALDGKHPPLKIKLPADNSPIRWLTDDKILLDKSTNSNGSEIALATYDLRTGQVQSSTLPLSQHLDCIFTVKSSTDRKRIAYSGYGLLSDLFLLRGLR